MFLELNSERVVNINTIECLEQDFADGMHYIVAIFATSTIATILKDEGAQPQRYTLYGTPNPEDINDVWNLLINQIEESKPILRLLQ